MTFVQMLLSLSPAEFELAAAPAVLVMVTLGFFIFRGASRRTGFSIWKHVFSRYSVRYALNTQEKLLWGATVFVAFLVLYGGVWLVVALRHGA